MPYGDDITEGIPYNLSNPAGATNYSATGEAYDVAISGYPFFLAANDETPYRRVTAQYRKQQIDQTREAGEQTITGWWLRSQSSFHLGAGIKYFEPAQDESLRFQFTASKGVDIFTKGEVTLLNATAQTYTGGAPAEMTGVNDGTNNCVFITDGTALKKITAAGTTTTITQAGTASTIYSITSDGNNYYFINGSTIHRGSVGASPADSVIYNAGTVTRATIRYVKQRLIVAIGNVLYELNANASGAAALPTALYTHPNINWVWSSISEGPQAIYVSGYDSTATSSAVFKITLNLATPNSLGFPSLNVPTVVIDMPTGESINDFDVYLGLYAVLATSKGVRVGISDNTGDVSYGPLLFFDAACNSISFRDKYAYLTSKIDGEAGLVKVDLSNSVLANTLVFPWAWDVAAAGTNVTATQVAFYGNSDKVAFTTGNNIWSENEAVKVSTGYIQSGFVRYNTLENKLYKVLTPRFDSANGGITILSVAGNEEQFAIGAFSQGAQVTDIGIAYPTGPQQFLGFKFIFSRSDTNSSKGPIFTGFQLKALPAIPRQRLIQYPVFCYDHEMDKFNNAVGYEGSAYTRLLQLEGVENAGDSVRVEDFRTGESYLGIIEEMDFINKTPTDKRFSGFGGTLLVTIRTI